MPILIKDYCWQQTEKYITIKVPLKAANKKDVDLLTSNKYIKAFYNPYLFEAFLLKPIDKNSSSCIITDTEIVFELCKVEPEPWDALEVNLDKKEKLELKKKYLEDIQQEAQKHNEEKSVRKSELKRVAVREQIAVDTDFRNRIEEAKKFETQKALKEMRLWENESSSINQDRLQNSAVTNVILDKTDKDAELQTFTSLPQKSQHVVSKKVNRVNKTRANVQPTIPLPRKSQTVNVEFTKREFSTPSRESKAQEEQEWLLKQAEAKRAVGFDDEDLRPEERNPQWLKDKGDEFFKTKNYLGAISAYSTGIKISKNFAALYVNRSAAHFAVGNMRKTIHDCTTALELLTPACEANRIMRAKCLARRGAALCELNMVKEAKGEIEAALKLVPDDQQLRQDLENITSQL